MKTKGHTVGRVMGIALGMLAASAMAGETDATSLTLRNGHVVLDNGCEELQITFYDNNLVSADEFGCVYAGGSGGYSAVGQYVASQPVIQTLEAQAAAPGEIAPVPGGGGQSSSQYLLYYTVDSQVVYAPTQGGTTDPSIQPPIPLPEAEDQTYLLILDEGTSRYQRYLFSERGPKLEEQGTWRYCQQSDREGYCQDKEEPPVPVPLTAAE